MKRAPKFFTARVSHEGKRIRVKAALPTFVGVTRAAEMLGVPKSNISRLREQGRLDAVPVEGPGAAVFLKAEVEELAATLADERTARRARREQEVTV